MRGQDSYREFLQDQHEDMIREQHYKNARSYRQCGLERREGDFVIKTTTWLPSSLAVLGESARLRERRGGWGPPWAIVFVSREPLTAEQARQAERAYLKQRKASDI